jgi:hypothetical protein
MVSTGIEASLREGLIIFFLGLRFIKLLARVGVTVVITGDEETERPVRVASTKMVMVVGRPVIVRSVIGRCRD